MAIDTAEKRRSVAGINRLWGPGVTPNAAKDAEWRQQAGFGYSGIAAGEAVNFTLDLVCPLPVPAVARTNLGVPAVARTNLVITPSGCRNED